MNTRTETLPAKDELLSRRERYYGTEWNIREWFTPNSISERENFADVLRKNEPRRRPRFGLEALRWKMIFIEDKKTQNFTYYI